MPPTTRRGLLLVIAAVAAVFLVPGLVLGWPRIQQAKATWMSGGDRVYDVPSESMEPTFRVGDKVAASDHAPLALAVGDIVVTKVPNETFKVFKRVVALGPADVTFADGHVVVNGTVLDEPYLQPGTRTEQGIGPGTYQCPCHVPEGSFWGMGDNRTNSMDSRHVGPLRVDQVESVVVAIVSPPDRAGPVPGTGR